MFKRLVASLICVTFIFSNIQYVHAQDFSINQLPVPGTMINTTPAYVPLTLKGLIVHPENALKFDFLMDTGHSHLSGSGLSDEALKIMKYFLTALTIPEDDLWVNLSPYEKGRIIQSNFGQTIMGRDLLAQDYILKQLTASLIYPEKALGKEFWQQVYSKAAQEYGTTQIPVNTFNKVWIVPSEAVVWEHEGKVLIVKSHLKVMLEEDYLSLQKHSGVNPDKAHSLASNIVRTIILPVLEKEVNEGKNFAQLRQMYQAMILATWYKKALRESILNKAYADKKKVAGIGYANSTDIESIYQQYLKAFKKGAFNYIKEDIDLSTGQAIPRKYFSGGFRLNGATNFDAALVTLNGDRASLPDDQAMSVDHALKNTGETILVNGYLTTSDAAMSSVAPLYKDVTSEIAALKEELEIKYSVRRPNWGEIANIYKSLKELGDKEVEDKFQEYESSPREIEIIKEVRKLISDNNVYLNSRNFFFGSPERASLEEYLKLALKMCLFRGRSFRPVNGGFGKEDKPLDFELNNLEPVDTDISTTTKTVPIVTDNWKSWALSVANREKIAELRKELSTELEKSWALNRIPNWERIDMIYEALKKFGDEETIERFQEYDTKGIGKDGETQADFDQDYLNELMRDSKLPPGTEVLFNGQPKLWVDVLKLELKLCWLGGYLPRGTRGVDGTIKILLGTEFRHDAAMQVFSRADWRNNEQEVEKRFAKLGITDTLSELDRFGTVTKKSFSDLKISNGQIWEVLKKSGNGLIAADGKISTRTLELSKADFIKALPENWDADTKGQIYDILQEARYPAFFYKAGSDRLDELLATDLLKENNRNTIRQYFIPEAPAEYRNPRVGQIIPPVYTEPNSQAIINKLNDPRYSDGPFKKVLVDIIKAKFSEQGRAGEGVIHKLTPSIEPYSWTDEVLPEWLWYALSTYTSGPESVNPLKNYILKKRARSILMKYLNDPQHNTDEIINKLAGETYQGSLRVDEFLSVYMIRPLLKSLGLPEGPDLESDVKAVNGSIVPFLILIKDIKTNKKLIEKSRLLDIINTVEGLKKSILDFNEFSSVWEYDPQYKAMVRLKKDISSKDEEKISNILQTLPTEDPEVIELKLIWQEAHEIDLNKVELNISDSLLRSSLPAGGLVGFLTNKLSENNELSASQIQQLVKVLPENMAQFMNNNLLGIILNKDQMRELKRKIIQDFVNSSNEKLKVLNSTLEGKKFKRKILENYLFRETPSNQDLSKVLVEGIDKLLAQDPENKLVILEDALKVPSLCEWAIKEIDNMPGIAPERRDSISNKIRDNSSEYPFEVRLWASHYSLDVLQNALYDPKISMRALTYIMTKLPYSHDQIGTSFSVQIAEIRENPYSYSYALQSWANSFDKAALAEVSHKNDLGGISLNAKMLDLQIKRDGNGVPLPLSQQPLDRIDIQGFVPQIISIKPVDLAVLFND